MISFQPLRHLLLFLLLVILVASATCYVTGRILHPPLPTHDDDFHAWIHRQLQLTPEQDRLLEPSERRFAEKKKHYSELMRIGNMELANAILEAKGDSPLVKEASEKIHQSQGALQKATLEHVFEMRPILSAEQYEKLLDLTANALYQTQRVE